MLSSPASAASSAGARPLRIPALAQTLTVCIPQRPVLATVLESIKKRDETITMSSLLLTHDDIQRIVVAFSSVPVNSNITFRIHEVFTNPHCERLDDLILFWNAIKYKVTKIIWDQNKFYNRFLSHINNDIKNDPDVTAVNEFICCDRTDSTIHTPSTSKSSAHDIAGSPMERSMTPKALRALSIFPMQQRQLSLPPLAEPTLQPVARRERQISCPPKQ